MNRAVFTRILFLTAVFLAAAPSVRAEPAITTRYDYYEVQGKSKDELRQAMQHHPLPMAGGENDASTEWNIRWDYKTAISSTGCGVSSYQVSMDVVFHMPRWSDVPPALLPLKMQWDGFVKALQKHEDGHAGIGRECVLEVDHAIKNAGLYHNCGQLDGILHRTVAETIAKYRAKEVEYDSKTDHGMKQGAKW